MYISICHNLKLALIWETEGGHAQSDYKFILHFDRIFGCMLELIGFFEFD